MPPDEVRPEDKKDLFEATGELKGGYDMGMAQAYALEHAKKTQGEYVGQGKQRVPLIWNIESSRYDEDAECFKVVLSCHPEGVPAEQNGLWEYHVRSTGGLMPGTPLLRQSLRYTPLPSKVTRRPWAWALLVLVVLGLIGAGAYAAATLPMFSSLTATPTPGGLATATAVPTRPAPTATLVVRPTFAPTATLAPAGVTVVAPTATRGPLPTAIRSPTPLATLAQPMTTVIAIFRPTPTPTTRLQPVSHTLNFGGLSTGDLGSNALAPNSIWLTSGSLYVTTVEPKGQVVPSGVTQVAQLLGPGFPKVVPTCSVLAFGNPVSATAVVRTVTSFTISRIGTTGGGSIPAWRMRAFDVQGKQVGTDVGEGPIPNTTGYFAMPPTPKDFTVAGPGITKIEFCAHNTLSTYGSLPIYSVAWVPE